MSLHLINRQRSQSLSTVLVYNCEAGWILENPEALEAQLAAEAANQLDLNFDFNDTEASTTSPGVATSTKGCDSK